MRVVGLTGGVGAGKSLVLQILEEEYHAQTIKADDVAKELMEPGENGYQKMIESLGDSFLNPDGTINRQSLAKLIFEKPDTRKTVDVIIHPLVWKIISNRIKTSQSRLIVVEFAIMGEDDEMFDEMWYVHATESNRIIRLSENRGYTRERSESMIKSQASEEEYMTRCDRVIENNGSIEEIRNQLTEILNNRGKNNENG